MKRSAIRVALAFLALNLVSGTRAWPQEAKGFDRIVKATSLVADLSNHTGTLYSAAEKVGEINCDRDGVTLTLVKGARKYRFETSDKCEYLLREAAEVSPKKQLEITVGPKDRAGSYIDVVKTLELKTVKTLQFDDSAR